MTSLILCEKPSVAKSFALALSVPWNNGFYANHEYIITNCVGHLFELFMPEDYNENLKKWTLDTLPIIPDSFKYKKNNSTKDQANLVLKLLQENKTAKIIIATDAGREGELIARITLLQAGFTSIDNIYRFWESAALTPEVITLGLKNAKPLKDYNVLGNQGYARQQADWLIGINFSRLLSILSNTLLPVGRVQTAVLNEIYKRELEIKNFIPKEFFEYTAELASSEANLKAKKYVIENEKLSTHFFQNDIDLSGCIGKKAQVKNIESNQKKEKPEKLFNLTALQKEAFKSFGISPDKTLNIVQKLYEEYKCLSYPRTPSRVLSESNVDFAKEIYEKLKQVRPDYTKNIDLSLFEKSNSHVFDDTKLEDHHALVPLIDIPHSASEIEKGVFELIVKQFFAVFSKPYIYESKTVYFNIAGHDFIARGKKIIQKGWKELASSEANLEEDENSFENVNFENLICKDVQKVKKLTKPKAPYKFDSLLAFMENPKNESENKKLVGLGTEATRGEIIKSLIDRDYIKEVKKNLTVQSKGIFLIEQINKNADLLPLIDISQTTQWEEKMMDNPGIFLKSIKDFVFNVCKNKKNIDSFEKEMIGKCPSCGKDILEGKKNYYCSGYKEGCKFVLWKDIAGAKLSIKDVKALLVGKNTDIKTCKNKDGKSFKCSFALDTENKIKFIFDKKGKIQ